MAIFEKENGTWKPVSPYVKDVGTWKPVVSAFVKVNGKWVRTTDPKLQRANFQDFTVHNSAAARYLDDGTHRLELHSGRTVTLSGDGVIDVPLNVTIQDDASHVTDVAVVANANVKTNGDIVTLTCIDKGNTAAYGYQRLAHTNYPDASTRDIPAGLNYTISVKVKCSNPSNVSFGLFGWGNAKTTPKTNDWETLILRGMSDGKTSSYMKFSFVDPNKFGDTIQIDFSTMKLETATSVSSQVTYYDVAQKKHVSPTLPLDMTYTLQDVTFNNLVVLDTKAFTQADRDMMDAEPELVVKWALGADVGFSVGTKGANDKVYCATEPNGSELIDIHDTSRLLIKGTYTRANNSQYGLQTLLLDITGGVPTAVESAGVLNVSNGYLEMKWKPDTPSYTLELTDVGKVKKLTHNPDKFYVDGVDTTPVPALPPATQFLHIGKDTMGGLSKLTKPIKIEFYVAV